MNYRELQAAVKAFKAQGLTSVKLTSKVEVLQAEYDRLTAVELDGQCSELACEVILSCPVTLACHLSTTEVKSPKVEETPTNVERGSKVSVASKWVSAYRSVLKTEVEKQALDNVVQFGRAVFNIAKGFAQRQAERNAA